ncbi:MAG TPA: PQQ-binding-like beta-propeller repeat protein [Steroidobacteraceae bacterium]|jgi:PQQ-dependent dehydrogenase (methanol/ethanol family)|nr:PQQ-binding-like beta-propeller repeat protein [Steroidobacteraceae bacterium]
MRSTTTIPAAAMLCMASSLALAANDWPTYNRTLTSDRYATLEKIDNKNVVGLKVLCSFDTGEQLSFQSGLVQADGALFGTTERATFSIDPNNCKLNWRSSEEGPSGVLKVNRGLAWLDRRVFRGTADGKVIAYDAKNGKRLWSTVIADPTKGESVPAAPIAWNGLVFVGNAGGDNKGVKGRMYALDDKDGHIVWEFYLVPKGASDRARGPAAPDPKSAYADSWKQVRGFPITGGATWTSYSLDPVTGLLYVPAGNPAPDFVKEPRQGENLFASSILALDARTGAYQRHFQLVKRDFHDWDVSAPPALFLSNKGHRMLAEAPKDGHLYLIDLTTGKLIYRKPVTTIANAEAPMTAQGTHFCPGTQGGAEWNGPAFDPADNLIFTGEVDWCTTVQTVPMHALAATPSGKPWGGATQGFGKQDDPKKWSGWLMASNAESGERKWEFHAPFPVMSGVTPTTGGLVLFGDMGGNFYAFDAASGKKLWSKNLGGAIGGGVITYDTGAGQKIAVAAGMTSPIWPTTKVNGKVIVLSL